jgi:hypothetical protein
VKDVFCGPLKDNLILFYSEKFNEFAEENKLQEIKILTDCKKMNDIVCSFFEKRD